MIVVPSEAFFLSWVQPGTFCLGIIIGRKGQAVQSGYVLKTGESRTLLAKAYEICLSIS